MSSLSMVRAKCYLVLQGLERSLSDNLVQCSNFGDPSFLTPDEQERALKRLREDIDEPEWRLEDARNDDLLPYLDLGDLVQLLNRHNSMIRNVHPSEIGNTTKSIGEKGVYGIRKRVMHPIRLLEADDLPTLMSIPMGLYAESPNMTWERLLEGARLAERYDTNLDVTLPSYWMEEESTSHNLPTPEFDDTGFIGRQAERRQLKSLLESNHSVITVVGAGGVGKTALALRVCHDIIEDSESKIGRIVWVSLKTQNLTLDGIRTITDSVDTTQALVDRLLSAINLSVRKDHEPAWQRVVDQMAMTRTLLVIDNLETLGSQIRDLAISIPDGSKLLLTSRVGLGEIELRYSMPDLSANDAVSLMRHLGVAYNYTTIKNNKQGVLKDYCSRLHHNPLLIKWFVQAVGKGTSAEDILSNDDFEQALRFCWENVFSRLSQLSVRVISILQAARRNLSQTQLQDLVDEKYIPFVQTMQELHQSNIIEKNLDQFGNEVYQIGSLVFDYLSRYHPPTTEVVTNTRAKIKQWQTAQDNSAFQQNTYRYNRNLIHIESNDQGITAPHLQNAIAMMRANNFLAAHESLERARELMPQWSEIYRIKAWILEQERAPIYEIEQEYEESLLCGATDINRFHYATFLLGSGEFSRALERIDEAASSLEADEISMKSVRGQILLRGGQILPALEELEYVWNSAGSHLPNRIRRVQGTQLADALRRRVEQLRTLGRMPEAEEQAKKGTRVVNETAEAWGWDWKLAEVGVNLINEILGRSDPSDESKSEFLEVVTTWESGGQVRMALGTNRKHHELLDHVKDRLGITAKDAGSIANHEERQTHSGVIKVIRPYFGFIQTQSLGDIHMNPLSLVDPRVWHDLQTDQQVAFNVVFGERQPHATDLELIRE